MNIIVVQVNQEGFSCHVDFSLCAHCTDRMAQAWFSLVGVRLRVGAGATKEYEINHSPNRMSFTPCPNCLAVLEQLEHFEGAPA